MSTHFDDSGRPRMVDVTEKGVTARVAIAESHVSMQPATAQRIQDRSLAKGDVLMVAQLAAIQAVKLTSTLIPLCHAIPIEGVEVAHQWRGECETGESVLRIEVTVRTTAKTGVEMEALTAASVAALTVYDMCKSIDRVMEIGPTRLSFKSGGKSGSFQRPAAP